MVTLKDISRRCGVSPATVSKALNGYGEISAETTEYIKKVAQEMRYLPNSAARQLKTNTSHNIGVLFEDKRYNGLTHEYYMQILNSFKKEAEKKGYDITLLSQNVGGEKLSFLEHCRYRKCDGVVIASVDFADQSVMQLVQSDIPTITIDHTYHQESCVLSDNVSGPYELVNHLYKKGHRKIAFIHGQRTPVTNKRLVGFYKACEELGVEVPEEYVLEGIYHDPESSGESTKQLMELACPPTAILYPDDYSYVGGMNQLEKMGIRVPDDVSVVGYDGIRLSQALRPRLTTYYQDTESLGREAAKKLIESIEDKKNCIPEQIMVNGRMLEGDSVKELPV